MLLGDYVVQPVSQILKRWQCALAPCTFDQVYERVLLTGAQVSKLLQDFVCGAGLVFVIRQAKIDEQFFKVKRGVGIPARMSSAIEKVRKFSFCESVKEIVFSSVYQEEISCEADFCNHILFERIVRPLVDLVVQEILDDCGFFTPAVQLVMRVMPSGPKKDAALIHGKCGLHG